MLASIIIMAIGLVPGIPLMPFMALSTVTFAVSYVIEKAKKEEAVPVPGPPMKNEEREEKVQPLEILELEIGYALIPIVDAEQGGELLDKIRAIRKQVAMDLGIVVPPMKLKDNLQLKAGEYMVQLKGIEVGRGELMAGHVLAMSSDGNGNPPDGIPTKEPVFNLDAYWVKEADRDKYMAEGLTIVDHPTIIATHLTEIVRNNAHELLTRRETQKLIDSIASVHQKVIEEITQNQINMGSVQKVLQNLLREQVSIRDLVTDTGGYRRLFLVHKGPGHHHRIRQTKDGPKHPEALSGRRHTQHIALRKVFGRKSDCRSPGLGPRGIPRHGHCHESKTDRPGRR